MKKIFVVLLSVFLAFGAIGCSQEPQVAPQEVTPEPQAEEESGADTAQTDTEDTYTAGTYTSVMKGFGGDITVSMTFDESSITDVKIMGDDETEGIGGRAIEEMPQLIFDKQSANVDTVSGATVTSEAIKNAVEGCIAQATGTSSATVADGTYTASAVSYGWLGMLKCEVTFAGGKLTDIKVLEESDSTTGEVSQMAFDNYIPRVIEAQSLDVDAVSGATITSNAIRTCVDLAIKQAGGSVADWQAVVAKSTDTVKLEGYDVVVIGMGGSGILSYCAAAEQGATVFGIETTAKLGGQSATTTGPMALNSEHMKNNFFEGKDYINPDEVFETWMEYVGSDEKEDIIRKAVYESGSSIDWAIDSFEFSFNGRGGMLPSFANPQWTAMWTAYTADDDNTSRNIFGANKTSQFDRAVKLAVDMNEKNDYMLELTATELIFDGSGNVIGVKAEYYDGTTYEIYGDTFIIATGGYIGNSEMMKKYLDGPTNTIAYTVNDGSGINFGQSAGGALYSVSVPPMIHITQVRNMIKNDDLSVDQKAILSALCLVRGQTAVTTGGEAWDVAEEICMAPDYMYYLAYSEEEIEKIRTEGLGENFAAATSYFMSQGGSFEVGVPVSDIDKILEVGINYGNVIKADSIADLASEIGCDEATLSSTLGGNDGVYYAVIASGYSYGTVGGLDVDVNMNVLREDGSAIENLYCVGQDSQGVGNINTAPYTPWGGQAQSWTFVSGRTAGEHAAQLGMSK